MAGARCTGPGDLDTLPPHWLGLIYQAEWSLDPVPRVSSGSCGTLMLAGPLTTLTGPPTGTGVSDLPLILGHPHQIRAPGTFPAPSTAAILCSDKQDWGREALDGHFWFLLSPY